MTAQHIQSTEQKKKHAVEQIWLHYYNQTLFEKGLITETERNRMSNLINASALVDGKLQISDFNKKARI